MEALIIPPERLRALMIAQAELGERIMRALIMRRVATLQTRTGRIPARVSETSFCCGA